jgi:hypothetical protein
LSSLSCILSEPFQPSISDTGWDDWPSVVRLLMDSHHSVVFVANSVFDNHPQFVPVLTDSPFSIILLIDRSLPRLLPRPRSASLPRPSIAGRDSPTCLFKYTISNGRLIAVDQRTLSATFASIASKTSEIVGYTDRLAKSNSGV